MDCPLTNAIFGIVGVLTGGLIGNWLALGRDCGNRKREFVAFLNQWRSEILRATTDVGNGYQFVSGVWQTYQTKVHFFKAGVSKVRKDYFGRNRFDALTGALGNINVQ